ncbi:hypothetical protein NE237_032807 [Protea cynaroides]|uniref:Interactor of constitutive active ROPs 4 n=1 Tax=Protea cynaroides TaxID=273540 RepID=A0A9Q0R3G0_9MAGN|nr:hypothetical protein NE237_032807 [Protea cynaroides]
MAAGIQHSPCFSLWHPSSIVSSIPSPKLKTVENKKKLHGNILSASQTKGSSNRCRNHPFLGNRGLCSRMFKACFFKVYLFTSSLDLHSESETLVVLFPLQTLSAVPLCCCADRELNKNQMPRSRASELPQGQSLRVPLLVRTSSSCGFDSLNRHQHHQRPTVDRSPKVGIADRRSPKSLHQKKKLGTRIADLESQLGHAQVELKKLKDHLASELEMKVQKPIVPETRKEVHESLPSNESTDVFEVPVEPPSPSTPPLQEPKKLSPNHDSAILKEEIDLLNEKLLQKEKELELSQEENKKLKKQVKDAAAKAALALTEEEETVLKLAKIGEELGESKTKVWMLNEKLEAVEESKMVLEIEIKKLRVQTEQWKKAADAAAEILSGEEMNGRTVRERSGSMDKHLGSGFRTTDGFGGFVGSPLDADELDDGFGSGRRKGAGIRMFGDKWKRKGQK